MNLLCLLKLTVRMGDMARSFVLVWMVGGFMRLRRINTQVVEDDPLVNPVDG